MESLIFGLGCLVGVLLTLGAGAVLVLWKVPRL